MENKDTKELLKIIMQQNQVIIQQGKYIADLAYALKYFVIPDYPMESSKSRDQHIAMNEMADELLKYVKDNVLYEDESNTHTQTK